LLYLPLIKLFKINAIKSLLCNKAVAIITLTTTQRDNKMTNSIETMVTYSNKANPFNSVLIKSDDSFVIIGDDVSDSDLLKMNNWEEVAGWNAE